MAGIVSGISVNHLAQQLQSQEIGPNGFFHFLILILANFTPLQTRTNILPELIELFGTASLSCLFLKTQEVESFDGSTLSFT